MAREFSMDILVEVHDEHELEVALSSNADLIGVNNRNLKTFSVDVDTTYRLKRLMPDDIPLVSESGLKSREDFLKLKENGVEAALVGESLMRAGNGSDLLKSLRS